MPLQLDPDKLCRDVEARAVERLQGSGPSSRQRSGAMAAIREHLATIMALRDGGATWPDIGVALTAQGFTRGDGGPLTGRHLSALIASIRRQDAGRAAARARRTARADLHHAPEAIPAAMSPRRDGAVGSADDASVRDHDRGNPDALFDRIDQKARQAAKAAAERPDFSKGLIK